MILLLVAGVLTTGCDAVATSPGSDADSPSIVLVTPNPVGVNDFPTLAATGAEDAAAAHKGTHGLPEHGPGFHTAERQLHRRDVFAQQAPSPARGVDYVVDVALMAVRRG